MEEESKASQMSNIQESIKRLMKLNPKEFWLRAEAMERAILKQAQKIKQEEQNKDIS